MQNEPKGSSTRSTAVPNTEYPLSKVTTTESRVSQHILNNNLSPDLTKGIIKHTKPNGSSVRSTPKPQHCNHLLRIIPSKQKITTHRLYILHSSMSQMNPMPRVPSTEPSASGKSTMEGSVVKPEHISNNNLQPDLTRIFNSTRNKIDPVPGVHQFPTL